MDLGAATEHDPHRAFATMDDIDAAVDSMVALKKAAETAHPVQTPTVAGGNVRGLLGAGFARLDREGHLKRAADVVAAGRESAAILANRWKGKTLIIVGSGPSLNDSFHDLNLRIMDDRKNVCVMSLNKSHDALIAGELKEGSKKVWKRYPIVPEFAMMLDPKPWCASYITPHNKPLYLLGSSVDPCVWEKFDAYNAEHPKHPARMFWFYPIVDIEGARPAGQSDVDEFIQTNNLNTLAVIAGGSNVGLRALNMAMLLGFETVELWGFDSCYAPGGYINQEGYGGGQLYAFDKPHVEHNAREFEIECREDQSRFRCMSNEAMQRQLVQFDGVVREIEALVKGQNPTIDRMNVWKAWVNGQAKHTGVMSKKLKIRVAGDGAIPWMAWKDGGPDRVLEHMFPARMEKKYGKSLHWDYTTNTDRSRVIGMTA